MSRIEKLSILGVRSFGISEPQTIAFNTPLTLIVGYNGSGKTTVIECLKYAATGQLPPNSKGGAFIHDPDLEGEKEIHAQVKLSFRSTIGESYVVTRNLQLTVRKITRNLKTLEGSLLLRDHSQSSRHVISSTVAALDKLVPEKLGVSTAVLDAVIFCHQDESLWPMSEPTVLKKRFDEIFESQRYAKVIDSLKVLRKKKGEDLKELKILETHDKANKERADKVYKLMSKLAQQIEESQRECDMLREQIEQEQAKIKEKHLQANSFLDIVNDLTSKRKELQFKNDAIKELRSRIDELSDTDDSLRVTLDEYAQTIERTVRDRDQKKRQQEDVEADLHEAREKHTAKVTEQGKLQSEKEKYERQLVMRDNMIHEAANQHEIRGYDGDLDDRKIHAFNERIQKLLADRKRELGYLQRENAEEVKKRNKVISEREVQKQSLSRERASAKERIMEFGRESAKVQAELSSLDIDEGSEAVLRTEMNELEARINTIKAEEQAAGLDSQIERVKNDMFELQTLSAKLRQELVECTRLASERAQLDLHKKQLTERRRDLDILTTTWNEQLSALIGPAWKPETIEAQFQNALKRQNDQVGQTRKSKDTTQQELKTVEYKLSKARDKQAESSAEKEKCKNAVLKALKDSAEPDSPPLTIEDYESQVKSVEEGLATVETDLALFDHLVKHYGKIYDQMKNQNKCKICTREFAPGQEGIRKQAMHTVANMINGTDKEEWEKDKTDLTEALRVLKGVRSQYDAYLRLEKELPSLIRDIETSSSQKEGLVRRLEDHDLAFREADDKRQEIEALNKNVLKIAQAHKDIQNTERQVDRSQKSSGISTRSADEINEEQNTCAEKTSATQAKLNKLTTERQRLKDLLSNLDIERLELRNKITNTMQQLERKRSLQESIRKFKEQQAKLRETVQEADKALETLEPEIASARAALEEVQQQGMAKEQKIADERDKIQETVNGLTRINYDIKEYLERGGPSNLASNQRAVASLASNIARLEAEIKDLVIQINKLNKEIDKSDAKKRNIADNLTYRKNKRDRDALIQEIEDLESRNAQEDYDRLIKEEQILESNKARLTAKREQLMGKMATRDEEFGRLTDEYEQDLKGAKAKYKESHIKVETTKAAIEDLGSGTAALDHAIMQFHVLKMEEINRTIGELWQSTYQGTDIDTIQIRSQVDGGAGSGAGKRMYNYRVVMVKGDVEMDMRGRCSAGQKVLASIIIRLALAESFGVNCGLIALDEPTTNLDSDNIRSLAESLHNIIKARGSQGNLQLIVITHDEEFLKHMNCSEFCDNFYKVSRDERQTSIIRVHNIMRISE